LKTALVTGAARGIGAALTAVLRGRGYEVIALDRVAGEGITVGDAWDVPYGLYDLVFLNAGVLGEAGPAWGAGSEEVWRVNFHAPRRAVQALVPGWLAAGHAGRIVFTASLAAMMPMPFAADYNATKAAVVSLAETMVHELRAAGSGIGVSVAVPSFTRSDLGAGLAGEFGVRFREFIDGGKEAGEVAERMVVGALAGEFLIVTHGESMEGVLRRVERMLTGAEPEQLRGRRMEGLLGVIRK